MLKFLDTSVIFNFLLSTAATFSIKYARYNFLAFDEAGVSFTHLTSVIVTFFPGM